MDALVDGLLEELNCDVVFKIPIFGGIPIYESVVVTWIIMAVVFLLCFFLGRNLSVENPGRRQVAVEAGVKFLNDFFFEAEKVQKDAGRYRAVFLHTAIRDEPNTQASA